MKIKKTSWTLKTLLFAAIIFFSIIIFQLFSLPAFISAETIYAETKLEDIKKEKEDTRKKIEQAEAQQEEYAAQVEEVEGRLLGAFDKLTELNDDMASAKSDFDKTTLLLVSNEQEIDLIESQLQEKSEMLNNRIAEIYKNNNRSFLDVVFKADDFIEFISRYKLMNLLLKQDIDIINEVKDKKSKLLEINKNILDLQATQDEEKKAIEELISISEENAREIEDIYSEKMDLFSEAKANKDALIAMENQLAAKEIEVTNILKNYNYGTAPSGKLLWPTNGRISSGFGPRTSKGTGTTRMHNGIDIYAPLGTPVIAADSGQVLKAEYNGGYGLAILVYHGGGIATYYAHLSGINASVGQYVQKGQVIGYVGNTGFTTGYHLHFEVRIDGNPNNPMSFL